MLRFSTLAILLLVGLGISSGSARAGLPPWLLNGDVPSLAPMLDRIASGVVYISTESRIPIRENPLLRDPLFRRFFDIPDGQQPRQRKTQSLGSGVVVDSAEGYIITNHHVINKADSITVSLSDGRDFQAELVGSDPESDVALLHIDADELTQIKIGDSDRLRVGDFVVAIGNPFGLSQTVTSGIVSGLGRSGLGIEGYEDFIQTDASINIGNSGGALVNLHGELIGINTAILAPGGGSVGIGFAIPINMVQNLKSQILQHGKVRRGRLGVYIQDLTADLADALEIDIKQGAVITQIVPGSAAEDAGLAPGDVVIQYKDKKIRNAADLHNAVGLSNVGDAAVLVIIRDGLERRIEARIGGDDEQLIAGDSVESRLQGAVLKAIDSGEYRNNGLLVESVEENSVAWEAGLRQGDIIVSVNRQSVGSISDLQKILANGDEMILLNIHRGDAALFLVIR